MKQFLKLRGRRLVVFVFGGLVVVYFGTGLLIGHQVSRVVVRAEAGESGDPVGALLRVVNSDESSIGEKDSAVWALGQLGSARALPTLTALYTGDPCDHARRVCQEGLAKAIGLCQGERNIGAVVWRHGELVCR